MNLTQLAKKAARSVLHRAGGLRGVRFWNRGNFRILMYHDFPAIPGLQDSLARQCDHLARYYALVSMTDIGLHLREGKPLPKNALAVTVDDGNRDFLLNAYPVFQSHRIPVTVYLVSGFLDGLFWLWWDKIAYLVEQSKQSAFSLSLSPGQPPTPFEIRTADQRDRAISTIAHAMKRLTGPERDKILKEGLTRQLGVELPEAPPTHLGPMTWDEVRQIAKNGIDIGAHTVTHPVLSRISVAEDLHHEIEFSKRRIEEELGRTVSHFCYPYGQRGDFNSESMQVLAQGRFQTAVTAQHGMNTKRSDPFQLARLSVDAMLPEFYFRERVAGLHSG